MRGDLRCPCIPVISSLGIRLATHAMLVKITQLVARLGDPCLSSHGKALERPFLTRICTAVIDGEHHGVAPIAPLAAIVAVHVPKAQVRVCTALFRGAAVQNLRSLEARDALLAV